MLVSDESSGLHFTLTVLSLTHSSLGILCFSMFWLCHFEKSSNFLAAPLAQQFEISLLYALTCDIQSRSGEIARPKAGRHIDSNSGSA